MISLSKPFPADYCCPYNDAWHPCLVIGIDPTADVLRFAVLATKRQTFTTLMVAEVRPRSDPTKEYLIDLY